MATRSPGIRPFIIFSLSIIILIILSGCNPSNGAQETNTPGVEIEFQATLPGSSCQIKTVAVAIIDDLQGSQSPVQILPMSILESGKYDLKIEVPQGSNIHYRYVINTGFAEWNAHRESILFRNFTAMDHSIVQDTIAGWSECQPEAETGNLTGIIQSMGVPVYGAWVQVAGIWEVTHSDGSFAISDIPAGIQTLSVSYPTGKYRSTSHLVDIQSGSTTPTTFNLDPAKEVEITWIVSLPDEIPSNSAIKFVPNHPLYGGMHLSDDWLGWTDAIELPQLEKYDAETEYFSGRFYEGMDLRYTYSLGDGITGRELSSQNKFVTRQVIVPGEDTVLHDTVETFTTNNYSPVSFTVQVPETTPATDFISIQFFQGGWYQPIPMQQISENLWNFTLSSGFSTEQPLQYRFCRNNLCSLTGQPPANQDASVDFSSGQAVEVKIDQWAWIPTAKPVLQASLQSSISNKSAGFISGMEWNSCATAMLSGQTITAGIAETSQMGSNLLVIRQNISSESIRGQRRPVSDNSTYITALNTVGTQSATTNNLRLAFFPTPALDGSNSTSANWIDWFSDYRQNVFDIVAQTKGTAEILILGGEWIAPYLPPDPQYTYTSIAPGDADTRWVEFIQQVRSEFHGEIWFALPAEISFSAPPVFLNDVDTLYLILDPASYADEDLQDQLGNLLDGSIQEIHRIYDKPLVIGFQAPAVSSKAVDIATQNQFACDNWSQNWAQWQAKYPVDLQLQLNTYQIFLSALTEREWINGFISEGNNPGLHQYDYSSNVYGKPASELLTYWNRQIKGK